MSKLTRYITVRVEVEGRQDAMNLFKEVHQVVAAALSGSDDSGRYTVHLGVVPSTVDRLTPAHG